MTSPRTRADLALARLIAEREPHLAAQGESKSIGHVRTALAEARALLKQCQGRLVLGVDREIAA